MKVVSSVSEDQLEILSNIAAMFCGGKFDCDPTYSVGNFYKSGRIPQPMYKFDLTPKSQDVIQSDSRNLPLDSQSIESIVFDPPFVAATPSKATTGIIKERFSYMRTVHDLWDYYNESLLEFARVLKPFGVVVFKCQDVIHGRRNFFSHCEVMTQALNNGFFPRDLFVLVAKNRIIRDNLKEQQQHARKYHSYFWVFEKRPCTIKYSARLAA